MKIFFLFFYFIITHFISEGQTGINELTPWRFINGDSTGFHWNTIYSGTQGFASEGNKPGARKESVTWTDNSGNLWLFGGKGFGTIESGLLNDLWKYDRSLNQWIFIKGDNVPDVPGVYGVNGVANDNNKPGARSGAVSWSDNSGNLWLFGGYGYYTGSFGQLNDLWKYNPLTNQWTWMKGDNSKNVPGNYGTQGVPAMSNNPGGRSNCTAWKDSLDRLWLFGGTGFTTVGDEGSLNDLWRYDPSINEWTWIKGDNTINIPGLYGAQGAGTIVNKPGARSGSVSWKDSLDNLYLFGGMGQGLNNFGYLNDLWKYEPVTNIWTWIKGDSTLNSPGLYGLQGTGNLLNKPGARSGSVSWKDDFGNLFLFGGAGFASPGSSGWLNDLWKYNLSLNQWTWIKGDPMANVTGISGVLRVADVNNKPSARELCIPWIDSSGNFWLFGGSGITSNGYGFLNDLWKYIPATNQWAWMKGDIIKDFPGEYGIQGFIAEGNRPFEREGSVTWKDSLGNLWLFGGHSVSYILGGLPLNDLWKYDIVANQWIWMKGNPDPWSSTIGVYGTKGIADINNNPGARYGSVSWVDNSGNFWLFGGYGYDNNGDTGRLNDLWRYEVSSNKWTWIHGDNIINSLGVYGPIGVASDANKPGARFNGISWADETGNLWLFGGDGYASAVTYGLLNDLWKYTPSSNRWTWIKGNNSLNVLGVYGMMGNSATANKPGARKGSVSWTDGVGNLWLFGGFGYPASGSSGFLNDLWKFNLVTSQWTWVKGNNTRNALGVYGTRLTPATSNKPGARENSASWKDNSGNLWLFGGFGYANSGTGFLNDLWKYNSSTNQWTWIKGDSSINADGVPGVKGLSSPTNKPISREDCVSWVDNTGNLWLHGGATGNGFLDDLWKFNPANNQWAWIKGQTSLYQPGIYGQRGVPASANNPGARLNALSWTDSIGNLWLFGGDVPPQYVLNYYLNDLWKYDPLIKQWVWVKGDSVQNSLGIYGTRGIGAATNKPGGRTESVSWKDQSGKLWLFGGNKRSPSQFFNDLWKYDPATNIWTWMKGDSTSGPLAFGSYGSFGVYGTKGVSSASNKPGARFKAVSWTDRNGNLWLFGGNGRGAINSIGGLLNDLWKYDISTNQWTWMTGDTIGQVPSKYGVKEVASTTNCPGGRSGSTSWVDSIGNFWLFGGYGHINGNDGRLNDLWKYNPATNQWTWMKGDSSLNPAASYGVLGIANSNNSPGSTDEAVSWNDPFGNIFLFGGNSSTPAGYQGYLNEMWKFNPFVNEWTFLGGGISIASNVNKPGSRYSSVSWSDPNGGLWLFGGSGYGTSGSGALNDLWRIYSGAKYEFIGDGYWSDADQWLNNLVPPTTITPGMDVTIDHLIPGVCINQGPITLQQFGKLRVESGKRLTVDQGDLVNAGIIEGPGNRPGELKFVGVDTSLLESTGSISTPIILDSKQMELSANTVTDSITLTGGSNLKLNNYNLYIGSARLNGDSANFIVTNGNGRLIRTVANSPVIFHVGVNDSSYSPVTITNSGVPDNFNVRVAQGIFKDSAITHKNVNRSWLIKDSVQGGSNVTLKMQWNQADEQPEFNRNISYISRLSVCPLPDNCSGSIFDLGTINSATNLGNGNYSIERSSIDSFRTDTFIVTSKPFVFRFTNNTGNGNWSNPLNWTPGIPAPHVIRGGMEVIIIPATGECLSNGNIEIIAPGKLTIEPGKIFKITTQ